MPNKRIPYISSLQIIGPLFVVLGHSLNGFDCTGAWYTFSKEWIYIFHMPLFFLVSGYLLSFKGYLGKKTYWQFVVGKAKRLILPYLCWNLIFWVPKFMAQNFIADDASLRIVDALRAFVFPRQNVWGHTWFLLGLFIVYLATPLFQKLFETRKTWVAAFSLAACTVLYILPAKTEFLALSDLQKDLLFFVIGCLLGQIEVDKFIRTLKRLRIWLIAGAVISSAISLIWFEFLRPVHFITCAFILLAFLSVFVSIERLPSFWEKLASFSFGIYIMHWPVMITVRILLHQVLDLSVPLTVIAMSVLGYILPIFIIVAIRKLPFEKLKKPLKYLLGV